MPPNRKFERTLEPVEEGTMHADENSLSKFEGRRKVMPESEYQELIERLAEYQQAFGSALVILPDGTMHYQRFEFSPVALTCPADMSEDEWRDIGEKLLLIQDTFNWYLGDWLVAGEEAGGTAWHGTYIELATRFKYKITSLKVFASVCRNVPPLTRINGLSFGHHRLVTKLTPNDRQMWLQRALDNEWSVKELRNRLKRKRTILSANALQKRVDRLKKWASQVTDKAALAKYLREIADSIDGK